MPFSPPSAGSSSSILNPAGLAGAATQTGLSLLTNAWNIHATNKLNRQQQAYNSQMYERQRADSLADWNMQNEYNSPTSQMARLREAGLNPNLVYDNGAQAGAPAPVRSNSAQAYSPHVPQVDPGSLAGSAMSAYFDMQIKQQTVDNLKAQNTLILQNAAKVQAETGLVNQQTKSGLFKYDLDAENRQYLNADYQTRNQKLIADVNFTNDSNDRANKLNEQQVSEFVQRIANEKITGAKSLAEIQEVHQRIRNLMQDERTKQLMNNMWKLGQNPNDPAWQRYMIKIMDDYNLIRK